MIVPLCSALALLTPLSAQVTYFFQIGSGVCWTVVYLLIIRRGFQDRTYGMPLPALAANLAWECIFAWVLPHKPPQVYINHIWFLFDLVILFQAFRFGRAALCDVLPEGWFYPMMVLALALAFGVVLTMTYEFGDEQGKYAAFGQNLMMSILFVEMVLRRRSLAGQSWYIGLFKLVGTLLPSVLFFLRDPTAPLLNMLFVAILFFDGLYLAVVYAQHRALRVSVWARS